ncbi:MAG: nucleotide exchange factor GrpE [Candidatus Stahlbacteria bacterium]|nr:nucleotide exchange factor GrpE [Candidatus Stahlbacteria bacterium]
MIKTLKQELLEVQESLSSCKDAYLRSLADLENYRKRVYKEKEDLRNGVVERLLSNLLPLMDDFERGLALLKGAGVDDFYKGIELIYRNFQSFLEQEGVASFSSVGVEFNPALHEAVGVKETDECLPNYVVSELARGYKLKDKVIRHSKVIVSAEAEDGGQKTEDGGQKTEDGGQKTEDGGQKTEKSDSQMV